MTTHLRQQQQLRLVGDGLLRRQQRRSFVCLPECSVAILTVIVILGLVQVGVVLGSSTAAAPTAHRPTFVYSLSSSSSSSSTLHHSSLLDHRDNHHHHRNGIGTQQQQQLLHNNRLGGRAVATTSAIQETFVVPTIIHSSLSLSSSLSARLRVLDQLRGGAAAIADDEEEEEDEQEEEEEDDEEEEEEEEEDDEDDAFGDTAVTAAGLLDDSDNMFAEQSLFKLLTTVWEKTPPLTKTYLSASMAATALGYVSNKNEFPKWLGLDSYWPILTKLQIWRPVTAFLNFGPFGMGYLMTAHFVWIYMSTLERLHHGRPYDFWIMILFGQVSMVIGYPILKLSPKFLGHNLSTFLVYVWSRYHEGMEVNMFGLFSTRAELLPWFFLGQTFLLEGEPPILDFLGIVFGHVYYHLKKIGLLRSPQFLIDWYQGDSSYSRALRRKYKEIGADYELQ